MASYSSGESCKQRSPSKASVLGELQEAHRTIRRLEAQLQRMEVQQARPYHSHHGSWHSHRPSSRGSSNDHGRDSQLSVRHIQGEYQVRDPLLMKYYHKVLNIMQCFSKAEIKYIPRELNSKADSLSKLASQQRQVQHNSVIQQTLNHPIVSLEESFNVTTTKDDWIKAYVEVIKYQEQGIEADSKMTKKVASFVFIGDKLYKRGFSTPLLKCLSLE